ncbi:MAG: hypothetical protein AB1461_02065 [Thermodesulfobacteriota bacterium]
MTTPAGPAFQLFAGILTGCDRVGLSSLLLLPLSQLLHFFNLYRDIVERKVSIDAGWRHFWGCRTGKSAGVGSRWNDVVRKGNMPVEKYFQYGKKMDKTLLSDIPDDPPRKHENWRGVFRPGQLVFVVTAPTRKNDSCEKNYSSSRPAKK